MSKPKKPHYRLPLRLPPHLESKVKRLAEQNRRTLTAQIILMLEDF